MNSVHFFYFLHSLSYIDNVVFCFFCTLVKVRFPESAYCSVSRSFFLHWLGVLVILILKRKLLQNVHSFCKFDIYWTLVGWLLFWLITKCAFYGGGFFPSSSLICENLNSLSWFFCFFFYDYHFGYRVLWFFSTDHQYFVLMLPQF